MERIGIRMWRIVLGGEKALKNNDGLERIMKNWQWIGN